MARSDSLRLRLRAGHKPRVVLVGPVYPQGGGVGTVDSTLLSCGLADDYDLQLVDTGRYAVGAGREGALAPVNLALYLRQLLRLVKLLLFARPQIVHQSLTDSLAFWKETSYMLVARLFGVKVVAHVHGNQLEVQYRRANPAVQRLMRAALGVPHVLLALSEHWRAFLVEAAQVSAQVVVVPNCVDPLVAEAMEQGTGDRAREPGLVLFLGGVGVRKGVPDALRAVPLVRRALPGARFVFAGPPATGAEAEAVAAAWREAGAGDAVQFPGLVTGAAKLDLLARAGIFILPSYHENFPVAILEAMAMGLPVVSTAVAGIPDIVEDGRNGFLIRPGDYQALAENIIRLARDPALREAMGRANIARVREEYLPRTFAARIGRVYLELLS